MQSTQPTWACIVQSAQIPTFQTISIFLQIRLDGSNYHISTAMLYSNEAINRCKNPRVYVTLQFFTFFPAIYSTYTSSARKKSSRIFSCARVRITATPFSPANMCIYITGSRGAKRLWQLCWLVTVRIDLGHILPMVNANSAQIGTDGVIWL